MEYFLIAVSILALYLGVAKRREESHWTTFRARSNEAPKVVKETEDLVTAGVVITSAQKTAVSIAGAVLGFAAVYILTGRPEFALLGLVAGVFAPRKWVAWKLDGQRKLFENQLEPVLNLLSSSLIAGGNVVQAWEQAALTAPQPAKNVLEHVVKLTGSGHSLARSLEITGGLVKSHDMQIIAAATTLCSQTGGDLAAVYYNIADTIRDKQTFKAQVEADMAQGNLSANFLAMIPFGFVALFRFLSPEYMAPLFNTAAGIVIFLVNTALILFGWLIIRGMTKVDY
ncbi:MAG: hypothetical protein HPY50_02260 [Firmicutes bacterium]|nr:hypothetical protein [Bacillota bacterium]